MRTSLVQLSRRQLQRSARPFAPHVERRHDRTSLRGPSCSGAASVATVAEPQAVGAAEKPAGEKTAQRWVRAANRGRASVHPALLGRGVRGWRPIWRGVTET